MKIKMDQATDEARIEIIPLIDVIFCILTFFILAALGLTRQSAIGVDLPRAATGTPQVRDMLVVSVDPVGQTYIDQTPVSRDELTQSLLQYQGGNPEGLIVLYASRSARYDDVINVLDLLRSVGGERVALATLPDSSDNVLQLPSPDQELPLDSTIPELNLDPNTAPDLPGSTVPPFDFPSDSGTNPNELLLPDRNLPPTDSREETP